MRADLQRFFNLTLDQIGSSFSAYHAGSCLACLPFDSALVQAVSKDFPQEERNGGGIEGIQTESLPLDQFKDWYEGSKFKEVEGWQETL